MKRHFTHQLVVLCHYNYYRHLLALAVVGDSFDALMISGGHFAYPQRRPIECTRDQEAAATFLITCHVIDSIDPFFGICQKTCV